MEREYTIFTDGGARGNPGPAAIGVVIQGKDTGKKEFGEYLGETTNNEAEYQAVIFAMKKLKQIIGADKSKESNVKFYIDSELLCRQVSGEYKVKEKNLQGLFMEVWNLMTEFKKVSFEHVRREKNSEADALVNQILDRENSKLDL